jgi:branched-chain amino acid aminotransferase
MNIFFIIGNKAITPDLTEGTILAGVTRDSVIQLLRERGFIIEERKLSIDEIVASYKEGNLLEVFGTGTAATISLIKEMGYKDLVMNFNVEKWKIAPGIKNRLSAIKEGREEDKYGWMMKL